MKKYLVELIGTFFLVLVIGLTTIGGAAGIMAPMAIGATLMVMVYAGGHLSGGHYNPAVTLAVWIKGKCETKDALSYMVVQVLGAILAAHLTVHLREGSTVSEMMPHTMHLLIAESLFTFALCYVVLSTAVSKKTANNSYFGLAIGSTVMIGAYAVGTISGAAFNPAVAFGMTMMGLTSMAHIWYFLAANFAGAAVAALVYKYVSDEK